MPIWLAVALGGASGSVARYGMGLWARTLLPAFPLGTLLVNVFGSLLIGVVFAVTAGRAEVPEWLRIGLITGVLGGFTTFSAFSLETLMLWREGQALWALGNIALNVLLGLSACALGLWLGRSL
jgi:fluoride exporter